MHPAASHYRMSLHCCISICIVYVQGRSERPRIDSRNAAITPITRALTEIVWFRIQVPALSEVVALGPVLTIPMCLSLQQYTQSVQTEYVIVEIWSLLELHHRPLKYTTESRVYLTAGNPNNKLGV